MRRFGHEELPGDLHLGSLCREVAEETAFLFNEEKFGQLLCLSLQNLNPLFQLGDEIMKLHGAWNAEVEVWVKEEEKGRKVYI